MSSITKCFEDVSTRVADLVGAAGDKIPNFGLGEQAKFKTEAPPRIVWVPVGGPIRRPKQAAGDQRNNPRQLWERELQIEARIWHTDIQAVEDLANHLAAAMQEAGTGSYTLLSESWDTSGAGQLGVQGTFLFSMRLPLSDEVSPSTTIGSATLTEVFATE